MIWTWLIAALTFIAKLIIPAPPTNPERKIDPNDRCPSCGHRDGLIRAYDNNGKPLVQHTCKVCFAKWYVLPILPGNAVALINAKPDAKPELVKPA